MVHYVAPSVWAIKTSEASMKSLAPLLDDMLCILPFEPPLWEKAGVRAHYVGHPVMERGVPPLHVTGNRTTACDKPVICLLPGSRKQELHWHLPLFRKTIQTLLPK